MSAESDELTATEVREILDRIEEEGINHAENVPETFEKFARQVVEEGTFFPDCSVHAEVSLTPRERITGTRNQDVTAMIMMGLLLGSALERDVPMGSEREEEWKNGNFELPTEDENATES